MKLLNGKLFTFVVLLVLTGLIVACGGAATPAAPAAEEAAPAEPTQEEPAQEEAAAEEPAEEAPAATSEGTPYKIGFVASITGPGSGLGVPERNTAEMLAQQWKETGVVGPDGVAHPVEVIILDSESNPDSAASAVSRLINEEEVDVLVAGTLSGNSMAMVPLATEAEVPLISMASARAIVADPDTGEARTWIFKTPQENIHSAFWQADYLNAQGLKSVCYLYENSGYGQDTLASAETAFGEAGIEIVYSDTFERSDTEFPQIASVQGAGCDAVVVGSIPPGASLAEAAVKDALPEMPVIQGHGVCNQQFIDLAPDAVEGTPLPCGRLLVADTLPDSDPQKALLLQYINDYTDFTGGEPISTFGGHAYDAMLWAAEALASLEDGMSLADRRTAIRDYIEGNITDWPGTGGIFNITPDDHLGLEYTGLTFVKVQDGGYVYFPPEEWGGSIVEEAPAEEAPAATSEGAPYKIGFVAAITGPGSGLGVPERNTAEMLAQQWKETGVVGPDGVAHPVEVIILDSESNPDSAASAVSRLINEEEVDVLVAGTLSGNSMAMVPLATEAEVPLISMASARAIVADPDTGEARTWIFKTPQENIHSAFWQADYLNAQGITSVCYLYENSGYGQDTLASAETAFGEAGIEIVYSDTFERSDTEFPQIVSVQGAGCEAVVIGSIPPGASLAAAAVVDSIPDMPVIQGHGVCNQQFIDLAPDAVEGTPLPCGRLLVADTLPDSDPQKALLLQYINDYSDYTGGEPISTFGGHAYDAMLWAAEALASLEDGMSLADRRTAIRDYVEGNITEWPGTGGIFNITPDDHLGLEYTGLTFVKVQDSGYVYFPPEEW